MAPECIQEMISVRQRLIEDYRISPDLMARCDDEIATYCKNQDENEEGDHTLHCLMKLARNRQHKGVEMRPQCKAQVRFDKA